MITQDCYLYMSCLQFCSFWIRPSTPRKWLLGSYRRYPWVLECQHPCSLLSCLHDRISLCAPCDDICSLGVFWKKAKTVCLNNLRLCFQSKMCGKLGSPLQHTCVLHVNVHTVFDTYEYSKILESCCPRALAWKGAYSSYQLTSNNNNKLQMSTGDVHAFSGIIFLVECDQGYYTQPALHTSTRWSAFFEVGTSK